jgi:hypothetical protein
LELFGFPSVIPPSLKPRRGAVNVRLFASSS